MAKKLLVLSLAVMLIATIAFARENTQRVVKNPVIVNKQYMKIPNSAVLDQALVEPVIFADDFEDAPMWIPDASWNHVEAPNGGRGYQPETSWRYMEEGGNHYWNAADVLDQELDFLVSPTFTLPTELPGPAPLKGLKIDYQLKGTTEADDVWQHIFGPDEVVWRFDDSNPGSGASSWFCDFSLLSTAYHWRQWLVTPEIDLTGSNGTFTFMHAYETELEFDFFAVDVSEDDFLTYTNLGYWGDGGTIDVTAGTSSEGWNTVTIDISALTGKTVKFRWSSKGDYGTAVTGWWVDDINIGGVFQDDGGEDGTTQMTTAGFTGGNIANGYFTTYTLGTTLSDWLWASAGYGALIEVPGLGTNFDAGSDVRMAFQWNCDGDESVGAGVSFDSVIVYGVGKAAIDLALLGVNAQCAEVGEELLPKFHILNNGLETAVGNMLAIGFIMEGETRVGTIVAQAAINVAPDSMFTIVPARGWTPLMAGDYTIEAEIQFTGDGDADNNTVVAPILVPSQPYSQPIYCETFDWAPLLGTLEDYGFTVINGGGDAEGNNINTWEFSGLIYGAGPLLSYAWGTLVPNEEVLDEALVTPPIDISSVGKNNTLHLSTYIYFRPSHPSIGLPFGVQTSIFTIEASIDGGETWTQIFEWVDDDSLALDAGTRLPNYVYYEETGQVLGYTTILDFDLTPVVWNRPAGSDQLWIKYNLYSENSYFVGLNVDEIMVYKGVGAPKIASVKDVPEDNGKQVQVAWTVNFMDLKIYDPPAGIGYPVTHYSVWREMQVQPGAKLENVTPVADKKAMLTASVDAEPGDIFLTDDGMYWNFLMIVPAMEWDMYSVVVPTLWDKMKTGFMVSAHTSLPWLFQESMPAYGMSTDDLAPSVPGNVAASSQNNIITVTWATSPEEDVQYYTVYRRDGGDWKEVGKSAGTSFEDKESLPADQMYYYAVSATDFAGNESAKSMEAGVKTNVAEFTSTLPEEFELYQNYPNPFNPVTYIRYSIPEASQVTITVYNANGQEVATLVDAEKSAGNYVATWDAANFGSGIYFYSIKAANFTKTIKMVLMK